MIDKFMDGWIYVWMDECGQFLNSSNLSPVFQWRGMSQCYYEVSQFTLPFYQSLLECAAGQYVHPVFTSTMPSLVYCVTIDFAARE